MLFNYLAKDQQGNPVKGIVEAANEQAAVSLIKSNGLFVVNIEKKESASLSEKVKNIRGISGTEKVNFTRQLATMINAGLPLTQALGVISAQIKNENMKSIINQCLRDVEAGSPLSQSMRKFPKVFSPTYLALLKAGEASGKLQDVLSKLANTMEAQQEFRTKFKSAMIYPIIVIIVMIGVFMVMMMFVVPKLADMYKSLNVALPATTQLMINLSDFMVRFWYLIILGFIGGAFAFNKYRQSDTGRVVLSNLVFKMPVFGKIVTEKELAEFTQSLSLLVSSGIPIVEALNISADVVENNVYKESLFKAAKSVESGYPLSKYLKSDPNFPPVLSQMVSVGEETGKMDEILDKLSHYFASNAETAIKGLSTAIEPIVLVLLGIMVGVLVVSIITPIYNLTSVL